MFPLTGAASLAEATAPYSRSLLFLFLGGFILGIGLPLVVLLLPLTWLFLTRVAFPLPALPLPGGRELLLGELRDLGPLARGERIVLTVFTLTAATLAASCAFMLPVATPPNAIVFGSGRVTMGQMAGAGIGLNLIATILVTMLVYLGGHLPLP